MNKLLSRTLLDAFRGACIATLVYLLTLPFIDVPPVSTNLLTKFFPLSSYLPQVSPMWWIAVISCCTFVISFLYRVRDFLKDVKDSKYNWIYSLISLNIMAILFALNWKVSLGLNITFIEIIILFIVLPIFTLIKVLLSKDFWIYLDETIAPMRKNI